MNHDEVYSDTWKDKKTEWLVYVKNVVLSTAFSYAWYTKAMEEKPQFSLKDCLSLPGLGWSFLNSMRTEKDEPLYTYKDK